MSKPPLTKVDMQEELMTFLRLYIAQTSRLFAGICNASAVEDLVRSSHLWQAVDAMYDYGVLGIPSGSLVPNGAADMRHQEAERFIRAMHTPAMWLLLDANDNAPPQLALRVAKMSSARMALDNVLGRYQHDADENGRATLSSDSLTIADVALLANMDERSVRNAANPRMPNPLRTQQVGLRTVVTPEDALEWLRKRRGFTPTQHSDLTADRPHEFDVTLPEDVMHALLEEAARSGMPLEVLLRKRLFNLAQELTRKEKP
ncbi:MAG: hypothetical protein R3E94_03270 [Burkholderiaceae bacterium]